MAETPIETLRSMHHWLRAWLEDVRKSPDPAALRHGELGQISHRLRQVNSAIQAASPGLIESKEWKVEMTEYKNSLKELRARLSNFEITLRIRRSHMMSARSRLDKVNSWADLAKHIG